MKIAIKGDESRGKEVIQILESLGGKNLKNWYGSGESRDGFFINNNGSIEFNNLPKGYKLYTLEEFEKEFPFKVGDMVVTATERIPHQIIAFGYYNDKLCYTLEDGFHYKPQRLELYKEMKEERNITLTLDKAKEWYKKGGELKEIALQAFTKKELIEKKWVDLGLPSGTLWCDINEEGYYSWDEMMNTFNEENLPKLTDFAELYDYCNWRWDDKKKGMVVTGPNGNCIFLPVSGFCDGNGGSIGIIGYYWSASPYNNLAYNLYFSNSGSIIPSDGNTRIYNFSVRCIKRIK